MVFAGSAKNNMDPAKCNKSGAIGGTGGAKGGTNVVGGSGTSGTTTSSGSGKVAAKSTTASTTQGPGKVLTPSDASRQIINADRTGSALKPDLYHRAPSHLSQEQLARGQTFNVTGGDGINRTLLQVTGELNGRAGVFEFLIQPNGTISHQLFKPGGIINGLIN